MPQDFPFRIFLNVHQLFYQEEFIESKIVVLESKLNYVRVDRKIISRVYNTKLNSKSFQAHVKNILLKYLNELSFTVVTVVTKRKSTPGHSHTW